MTFVLEFFSFLVYYLRVLPRRDSKRRETHSLNALLTSLISTTTSHYGVTSKKRLGATIVYHNIYRYHCIKLD